MRKSRLCDLLRTAVVLLTASTFLLLSCASCAPRRNSGSAAGEDISDRDALEISCEMALMRLERLIVERSSDERFPPALLLEAKELHRMGKELYLGRQYALALELTEEGILLLEEDSEKK